MLIGGSLFFTRVQKGVCSGDALRWVVLLTLFLVSLSGFAEDATPRGRVQGLRVGVSCVK